VTIFNSLSTRIRISVNLPIKWPITLLQRRLGVVGPPHPDATGCGPQHTAVPVPAATLWRPEDDGFRLAFRPASRQLCLVKVPASRQLQLLLQLQQLVVLDLLLRLLGLLPLACRRCGRGRAWCGGWRLQLRRRRRLPPLQRRKPRAMRWGRWCYLTNNESSDQARGT
jgi:hypothetical protein